MSGNKGTSNAECSKSEETKDKSKEYSCYRCVRGTPGFATLESLTDHLRVEHKVMAVALLAPDPQRFKCPKCTELFDTKTELSKHMMKMVREWLTGLERRIGVVPVYEAPCYARSEYEEEIYVCGKCGDGFGCVSSYVNHMQIDGTCCGVEKSPECNKNVERVRRVFGCHQAKISHEMKLRNEGEDDGNNILSSDDSDEEDDDDPPTSPIPSGSNTPLEDSTASKETGVENGVIHIQPVETLQGEKVVAVRVSLFKDERVRAIMKELDPSLDFSKVEDDIIGILDSKEKEKADDDHSDCRVVKSNPSVPDEGTVSYVMKLPLPKTQGVKDYEGLVEKRQPEVMRRSLRSRLVRKPYQL